MRVAERRFLTRRIERYEEILAKQVKLIDETFTAASGMQSEQLHSAIELLKYQFMSMVFGKDYDEAFDTHKPYLWNMTTRLSEVKNYLRYDWIVSQDEWIMIVIPEKLVSTSKKVELIQVGRQTGKCDLQPYLIRDDMDVQELPDSPYILIGVDDGASVSKKNHAQVVDFLKHQDAPYRRYACTADEGAMLAAYRPGILKKGPMVLRGSSYEKGLVPTIALHRARGEQEPRARMIACDWDSKMGLVPSYLTRFWLNWPVIRYKRDTGSLSNALEQHK